MRCLHPEMKRQVTEVSRPGSGVFQRRSLAWFQVPCAKQWLTVGVEPSLIPFGRVSSHAQLGRYLKLRKDDSEQQEAAKGESEGECAEAQASAATKRNVFRGSAYVRAQRSRCRCWCTRNVRSGAAETRRESRARVCDLH